jgi:hypothetical protein
MYRCPTTGIQIRFISGVNPDRLKPVLYQAHQNVSTEGVKLPHEPEIFPGVAKIQH